MNTLKGDKNCMNIKRRIHQNYNRENKFFL